MDLLNDSYPAAVKATFEVELADGRVIRVEAPRPHMVTFTLRDPDLFGRVVEVHPWMITDTSAHYEISIKFEARPDGQPLTISAEWSE